MIVKKSFNVFLVVKSEKWSDTPNQNETDLYPWMDIYDHTVWKIPKMHCRNLNYHLREHVKKIAFLAVHSAKALTPLPIRWTKAIVCTFSSTYRHIYVFDQANSYMKNDLKKIQKCPQKKFIYI